MICKNCVLTDAFPHIRFSDDGLCSYCSSFDPERWRQQKETYLRRFEEVIKEWQGRRPIDCLLAYSGGKDSSYTLYLLKEEFGLNVMALTMDNGFVSPRAMENMARVTEALDVDHLIVKPRFGLLKRIFAASATKDLYPPRALDRASSICTSCISLVKGIALKTAVEKGIPIVAFGWSPGQAPVQASVMKVNPSFIRRTQQVTKEALRKVAGDEIEPYFLEEHHLEEGDHLPYFVHPLAFLDYDEGAILEKITSFGWRKPDDTDPNSTNCLLNAFANKVHRERFGFHPYAFEIAGLVRMGVMSREEGLQKLSQPEDPELIKSVKERLGLDEA